MSNTVSFLQTAFKDLRCQNPACQAQAGQENRITLENLLFTGWECKRPNCGWFHEGAFANPDLIPVVPEYTAKEAPEPLTAEKVEAARLAMEEIDTPETPTTVADADVARASVLALVTESEHLITHDEIAKELGIELAVVDAMVAELIEEGSVIVGDPAAGKKEDDKDA